jgi:hypothetical protein
MADNGNRDSKAPGILVAQIVDPMTDQIWGTLDLVPREFKSGSVGFYGAGKVRNPNNPTSRYQSNTQAVLIGSKP